MHANRVLLAIVVGVLPGIVGTVATAQPLYWNDTTGLHRANADGSSPQDLTHTFETYGIALDTAGGRMFWSETLPTAGPLPGGEIRTAGLGGSGVMAIVNHLNNPGAVTFDPVGQHVYWSDLYDHAIYRADADGANRRTLLSDNQSIRDIRGLAIDPANGRLYFSYMNPLIDSLTPSSIARIDFDDGDLTSVIGGLVEPRGIALDLDAGRIYWGDFSGMSGKIEVADIDGGNRSPVVVDLGDPYGVAIDADTKAIYWSDRAAGVIQRLTPDADSPETIVKELTNPTAIAFAASSPSVPGDVNRDGLVNDDDIDLIFTAFRNGQSPPGYDLNGDGQVDPLDVTHVVTVILETHYGDANLDQVVNITDLSIVAVHFSSPGGWGDGDFNGDASVTITDLSILATWFGQGAAIGAATGHVPEPIGAMFMAGMVAAFTCRFSRRRSDRPCSAGTVFRRHRPGASSSYRQEHAAERRA